MSRLLTSFVSRRFGVESLLKNSAVLMLNGVVTAVLGFVFFLIVARFYSPQQVGLATVLSSVAGQLAALSTLGLHSGLLRFLPQEHRKSPMINSVMTIGAGLAAVLAMIFLTGLPFWSPGLMVLRESPWLSLAFMLFTIGMALFSMLSQVFIAFRRTEFVLALQVVLNLVRIPLVVAIASLGLVGLVSGWVAGVCLAVIAASVILMRILHGYRPAPWLSRRVLNGMARFSLGSYLAELLAGAPTYLLPLVILNTLGSEANAFFYMPFVTVSRGLFLAPYVFGLTLLTEGSYTPQRERSLVKTAITLTFAILIPIMLFLFVLGDRFLLLFGEEYSRNSLHTLWILASSSIPIALIEVYVAVKRIRLEVLAPILTYAAIAVVTLATSRILMGSVGMVGASIGWLMGNGSVAVVVTGLLVRDFFGSRRPEREGDAVELQSS